MPSISGNDDRHVIIDQRDGQYTCFPDVCCLPSGRIICAYNEFDRHVANRLRLLIKTSDDLGKTWSPPQLLALKNSHCPRLTVLDDGEVQLLDANGTMTYVSLDEGQSWTGQNTGLTNEHVVADKPLALDDGTLLTTAHTHRGGVGHPSIKQTPIEQMVFRSLDRGAIYAPYSVLHFDKRLALCEASMCRLPDGRIGALMRENSGVFEPMYLSFSEDDGASWSEPHPTALIGHRPTLGVVGDALLVTYRDVGPDGGTNAWTGSLDELLADALAHGVAPEKTCFTADGMTIPADKTTPARWTLRPMTDSPTATATIECEVRVDEPNETGASDDGGMAECGVHLGLWWRMYADRIEVDLPANSPSNPTGKPAKLRRKIPAGQFNTLRFSYADSRITLHVNGRKRATVAVDSRQVQTRAMLFGSTGKISTPQTWKRVTHRVTDPRYVRDYVWEWDHSQGLPHEARQAAVLELDNARTAAFPDFGYSGWCVLPDGRIFCAYHHTDGDDEHYAPGRTAHVRGAWFSTDDFA